MGLLLLRGVMVLVSCFGAAMFYLHVRQVSSQGSRPGDRPSRATVPIRSILWALLAAAAVLIGLKLTNVF